MINHEGKTGRVSELNVLKRTYKIKTEENEEIEVKL